MSSRPSAGRILPRYHLGKTDKGGTPLTPLRRAAAPGGVARQPALANHRGVGSVSRGSPLAQLSDTKGHAKAGSPATPQSRVGSVSAAGQRLRSMAVKTKAMRKLFDQFADDTGTIAKADLMRIATAQLINKPFEVGSQNTPRTRKKLPMTPGTSKLSPSVRRRQTISPTAGFVVPAAVKMRLEDPAFADALWLMVPKLDPDDEHEHGRRASDSAPRIDESCIDESRIDFARFFDLVCDLYDDNGLINESPSLLRAEIRALIGLAESIEGELDKERVAKVELGLNLESKLNQFRGDIEALEQASNAELGLAETKIIKLEAEKREYNVERARTEKAFRDLEDQLAPLNAAAGEGEDREVIYKKKHDLLLAAHRALSEEHALVVEQHDKNVDERDEEIRRLSAEAQHQATFIEALHTDIKRAEDSIAAMENDVKVHRDKNVVLTRELAEEQDMNAEAKTRRQSTTNSSPRNSPGGRASGMSLEDELQLSELGVAAGRSTSPDRSLASELDRQAAQNRSTENLAKMAALEDLIEQLQEKLGAAAASNADKTQQLQQMGADQVEAIKELQVVKTEVTNMRDMVAVQAAKLRESRLLMERWQQQAELNTMLYHESVRLRDGASQPTSTAGGADDARIEQNMVTVEVRKETIKSRHTYDGKLLIDGSELGTKTETWYTAPGVDSIITGRWLPAEDGKLAEQCSVRGTDWVAVCRSLPGRTDTQCEDRWALISQDKSDAAGPKAHAARAASRIGRPSSQARNRSLHLSTSGFGGGSQPMMMV